MYTKQSSRMVLLRSTHMHKSEMGTVKKVAGGKVDGGKKSK